MRRQGANEKDEEERHLPIRSQCIVPLQNYVIPIQIKLFTLDEITRFNLYIKDRKETEVRSIPLINLFFLCHSFIFLILMQIIGLIEWKWQLDAI